MRRIVGAFEDAGEPQSRRELADRVDLGEGAFGTALDRLRGPQVVRYVPERGAFRLTYWPEQQDCPVCSDELVGEEYDELELREQATNTGSTVSGTLHAECALDFLDELSLEGPD